MTAPATLQAGYTALPEHNLDQLRAVAVSCVFFSHLAGCFGPETPFIRWLGQAGVLAFFVHTALVLMSSLERDGAPNRPGWVPRFYLRRAFRIYPLAWAVIATVLVLHIPPGSLATTFEPVPLRAAMVNFALVQNLTNTDSVLAPLWTLPLELQMYALLPFCFLLARFASRKWLVAVLLGSIALDVFYLWGIRPAHLVPQLWRLNLLEYVPCFLMGVLAYASLRQRRADARLLPAWSWLPILLADIALVAPWWNTGFNFIARVVFCGVIGLAIPLVRETSHSVLTRAAHTIAVYSYGIYLIHLIAMRVGFGVLRDSPVAVQLLATFGVLGVSCYAGYHLIERPGILLGQRLLGARRQPLPLEATAPAP